MAINQPICELDSVLLPTEPIYNLIISQIANATSNIISYSMVDSG